MEENKKDKVPNVPNLRFDFHDEYSQILIGDYIIQRGKRAKGDELKYTAYSINNQIGFSIQQEQWGDASYTKLEKNGYKVIEYNDFAYNPARINVGSIGLYKEKTPCIVSSLYVCFATKSKLNPDYLFKYLKSDKFNKKVLSTQEGGVRTYFFYDKLQKTKAYIPSLAEQNKINDFLDLINYRIENQNKIIEDLSALRKGIIDSFFKDISDSTRLSDYLEERKTYSEKGEGYEHVTLSKEGICPKTDRYDRDFLVKNEDKNYKITKLNDICYNPANLKFRVICLNDYGNAIFSPIYVTFEVKNIDPYYLSLYLTSESFIKRILKYQQGTVYERMAVSPEDFCKGMIPNKSVEEIGSFKSIISVIDKKIKLERNILERFNIQKSYLLDNLFI